MWWCWHTWSSHLSYTVIHSPNFEANHSLTALVQCNNHLVVLPYIKLPFELRSYYYACTYNYSPTRHHPPNTTGCCTNLLSAGVPWELAFLSWKLQGLLPWFETQPSVRLNYTLFSIYMISRKPYLKLSKYVDKLLVVKTMIKN